MKENWLMKRNFAKVSSMLSTRWPSPSLSSTPPARGPSASPQKSTPTPSHLVVRRRRWTEVDVSKFPLVLGTLDTGGLRGRHVFPFCLLNLILVLKVFATFLPQSWLQVSMVPSTRWSLTGIFDPYPVLLEYEKLNCTWIYIHCGVQLFVNSFHL
jgi:hypothetical protein